MSGLVSVPSHEEVAARKSYTNRVRLLGLLWIVTAVLALVYVFSPNTPELESILQQDPKLWIIGAAILWGVIGLFCLNRWIAAVWLGLLLLGLSLFGISMGWSHRTQLANPEATVVILGFSALTTFLLLLQSLIVIPAYWKWMGERRARRREARVTDSDEIPSGGNAWSNAWADPRHDRKR